MHKAMNDFFRELQPQRYLVDNSIVSSAQQTPRDQPTNKNRQAFKLPGSKRTHLYCVHVHVHVHGQQGVP